MANNKKLEELALQLKHPHGPKGVEIAKMMNDTNIRMTLHSIERLNILDNESILELGHGNCGHLVYVFEQNNNLIYYGLETSELMLQESKRINQQFTNNQQASFYLYDGLAIPFPDSSFEKIFTVNTIYFWTNPVFLLSELYRVLKTNGILNITYMHENFMQQLPFAQFGFTFYDNENIMQLINETQFKVFSSDTQAENFKNKSGSFTERKYTTISLTK